MPVCLMKVAVTMKKINMMNTTSSMGVRLMSDSSSVLENRLICLRMSASGSVVRGQVILEQFGFEVDLPLQDGASDNPGERRDHSGHGRNGRHGDTGRHGACIAALSSHRVEDGDHA